MVASAQLLLLLLFVYEISSSPQLRIKQGVLRGQLLTSAKGRRFGAFTGIPYAEPPVGDLRFKVAQPAGRWNGVLNASQPHAVCPQSGIFFGDPRVNGNEDCLYLNVYTPQVRFPGTKLYPVMIYFHGGSFFFGGANRDQYDPNNLLDKDVVLVVPNYRLGPLGFLSTGDEVLPGNNGLKDQNLAIKWTKKNILLFGGDPESLTIFGQSAGGASAHFHMLSPLSKGFIKGVICESGTAFSPWAIALDNEALRNSRRLAQSFNCTINSSREMVECLRNVDAIEITRMQDTFYVWHVDPLIPFKPVIEPNIEGAFLPEHPKEIIKAGKAAKVPFITGINTEDGAIKSSGVFGNPQLLKDLSEDFDRIAPLSLEYDTASDKDSVTKAIREFYFGNRTIDNSSRSEVTNMYTDGYFLVSANEAVRLHTKYTDQSVYYYAFGYRGAISYSVLFGDPFYNYGVSHSDELIYLFSPKLFFPNYEPSEADRVITDVLTTLWTNFAITGNPTPRINSVIPTTWRPVQSQNLEYYSIKNYTDIVMAENLYFERSQFWKNLENRIHK